MKRSLKRAGKLVCILLVLLALLAGAAMAANYTDTAGHWAEKAIERWSRYHIIEGSGGAFRPNDTMTRAELAKVISSILGLTEMPESNPFEDVDMNRWYAPYVLRCYTAGIMLGDGPRQASPEGLISRQDAIVMLCRAFGIPAAEFYDVPGFTDIDEVALYALPYIDTLVKAGIVRGVTETTLCPKQRISRSAAVTLLDKMLIQYINEPGSYTLADGSGIVMVATPGEVTLTGTTSSRILVAPACAGGTVSFDGAEVHGAVEVRADGCVIRRLDASLDQVELIGEGARYENADGSDAALPAGSAEASALTEEFPQFYISEYDGASGGKSVVLSADCYSADETAAAAFQWYACDDIDGANGTPIAGATQMEYATGAFAAPEVRYYYCVITGAASGDSGSITTGVYAVGYTGLPTVCINTADGNDITSREDYVDADFALVASADYPEMSVEKTQITVKGRGNTTWAMPKKGYNFKFGKKTELLGLGKDKKWSLIANYADKSLLRNWFASDLAAEVWHDDDEWNPSYIPVDFVLNGAYLGSYDLVNPIKISDKRVNITDIEDVYDQAEADAAASGSDPAILATGGFVLEVDIREDAEHWFRTAKQVSIALKDPDLEGVTGEKADVICGYIRSYIQKVEDILYSDGFADPAEGYARYLDVDSFVDWYLVNEMTKNSDATFNTSVFMYYDPDDGLLHLGPNWDFDVSCGNENRNVNKEPTGFWIKEAKWISRLMEDPAFVAKVKARWNGGKDALYAAVNTSLQTKADSIAVSAKLNFDRWRILGRYVWPNAAGYETRTTYQSEIDFMTDWLNARYLWLDAEINALQ